MELSAEFVGPDGQLKQLRVPCEAPDGPDLFQGLLSGVTQMRALVVELFDGLVRRAPSGRGAAAPDEALDGEP